MVGTVNVYKSRVPHREEKEDNKESGYRGYTNQVYRRGRRRATIKRADTEATQNKRTAVGGEGRQ